MATFFRADAATGGLTWRSDIPGMIVQERDPLLLEESWAQLARLRCPLTVLVAGRHSMLDPDVAERVRARVPSARVVAVPEAGHDVHTTRPVAYLHVLDEVLLPASPEVTP
jgi:pimeloyl-ACP methyl ester carboxylesterase